LINFDKTIVIIPARKGSKGLPGKNKKLLNGKPLIQYSIDVALALFPRESICISTDDEDVQIIGIQNGLDVPNLRPDFLSDDKASARDVILHEVRQCGRIIDTIVYLQPTSPLRTLKNLRDAVEQYDPLKMDMLVSVKLSKANPYFNLFEEDDQTNLVLSKKHFSKSRQETPEVFQFNGAIYIINFESIEKQELSHFPRIKKFIMLPEESIDIDDELDWLMAERILQER
jgi:N-acylneuraminate cytidylyltransferase